MMVLKMADTPESLDEALRARMFETLQQHRGALRAFSQSGGFPRRHLVSKEAPRLRDDALTNARLFADREVLMRELARGQVGGEVGVQRGNFARFMLDSLEMSTLHLFDLNTHMIRDDVASDPRCIIHTGASAARLRELPDATFDWLYIDGDHSYPGVRKDVLQALLKVKSGGLIIFNCRIPEGSMAAF
jgi:hypothetical protein